jgi:hypothetical protein
MLTAAVGSVRGSGIKITACTGRVIQEEGDGIGFCEKKFI